MYALSTASLDTRLYQLYQHKFPKANRELAWHNVRITIPVNSAQDFHKDFGSQDEAYVFCCPGRPHHQCSPSEGAPIVVGSEAITLPAEAAYRFITKSHSNQVDVVGTTDLTPLPMWFKGHRARLSRVDPNTGNRRLTCQTMEPIHPENLTKRTRSIGVKVGTRRLTLDSNWHVLGQVTGNGQQHVSVWTERRGRCTRENPGDLWLFWGVNNPRLDGSGATVHDVHRGVYIPLHIVERTEIGDSASLGTSAPSRIDGPAGPSTAALMTEEDEEDDFAVADDDSDYEEYFNDEYYLAEQSGDGIWQRVSRMEPPSSSPVTGQ